MNIQELALLDFNLGEERRISNGTSCDRWSVAVLNDSDGPVRDVTVRFGDACSAVSVDPPKVIKRIARAARLRFGTLEA